MFLKRKEKPKKKDLTKDMNLNLKPYTLGILSLFIHSVMSDSLQSHELQHASLHVLHYLLELAQTHVH